MIKFRGSNKKGGDVVGLGLSRGNVERLIQGDPIRVDGKEMGLPGGLDILIFFGETEADMQAMLEERIGPDTKVYIDPKLKDMRS